MTDQASTPNVTYYDELAQENNAKNLYKESLKLEAQKILQEIEENKRPLRETTFNGELIETYLTDDELIRSQTLADMLAEDNAQQAIKNSILDSANAKLNIAYKHPGIEIELTHEEAKLLDPSYPFDDENE